VRKETATARYLVQAAYTPEGWAAQLKQPQDRRQVTAPLLERLGGRIASWDFAFGEYDVVAIFELPDNASAAALSLAVTASGAFKAIKTTPLLSMEEGLSAMRTAAEVRSAYRPPTAT